MSEAKAAEEPVPPSANTDASVKPLSLAEEEQDDDEDEEDADSEKRPKKDDGKIKNKKAPPKGEYKFHFEPFKPKYPTELAPRGQGFDEYTDENGEVVRVDDPYRAFEK